MTKTTKTALALGLFIAGIGVGVAAHKKLDPALFHARNPQDAARAVLDAALVQAGRDGSWERIGVGRAWYLGGHKAEGQAIFDALLDGDHEDSDVYRIARVYAEAHEWAKAKPLFDRFIAANPDDEKGLAEVGALYLLNGDRETAERLFARSFATASEVWATIAVGGSYLGVAPQE
jgi:tetratricopeptide (TPR) repeat protein